MIRYMIIYLPCQELGLWPPYQGEGLSSRTKPENEPFAQGAGTSATPQNPVNIGHHQGLGWGKLPRSANDRQYSHIY